MGQWGLRSHRTLQANNIDMDARPELDGVSDCWRHSIFENDMKKSSSYQPGCFTLMISFYSAGRCGTCYSSMVLPECESGKLQ